MGMTDLLLYVALLKAILKYMDKTAVNTVKTSLFYGIAASNTNLVYSYYKSFNDILLLSTRQILSINKGIL